MGKAIYKPQFRPLFASQDEDLELAAKSCPKPAFVRAILPGIPQGYR
jgi:hypothetical protein